MLNSMITKSMGMFEANNLKFKISPNFQNINSPLYTMIIQDPFTFHKISSIIPYQGWKIHISAKLQNYQEILNIVAKVCIDNNVSFKHINNLEDFIFIISKYCSPLSIGKYITVYPTNKEEFLSLIEKLYEATHGMEGVTILTDRKYKDSKVVHYRFGIMNVSEVERNKRPQLIDEEGNYYNDIVGAYFSLPPFVKDIFENEEEMVQNKDGDNDELILNKKYKMCHIVKTSSGGNVYYAINLENQEPVIIKEARPHVIVSDQQSVVELLINEKDILKKMESFQGIPRFVDDFFIDDTYFLVEEFIEGRLLSQFASEVNILAIENRNDTELLNLKIKTLLKKLKEYLFSCHSIGLIIDDISADNILITDTLEIKMIDFDSSYIKGDTQRLFYAINSEIGKVPQKLTVEEQDFYKLGFMFMGLLTNVNKIIKFEPSGAQSLEIFNILAIQNNLDREIIIEIIKLINPKSQISLESKMLSVDIQYSMIELDFLKQTLYRSLLLNLSNIELKETINYNDWETIKFLNISKLTNKKIHQKITQLENDIITLDFENIKMPLEKIRLLKILIGQYPKTVKNKIDNYTINLLLEKIKNEIFEDEDSEIVISYLSLLNDLLQIDRENSIWNYRFQEAVDIICESKTTYYNGIMYMKHYSHASPYLSNGNAGIITELIRYSLLQNNTKYRNLIFDFSEGIKHKYAKGLGVHNGLAGLALTNLNLYKFTKDIKYFKNCIEICKTIGFYKVMVDGIYVIPNNDFERISYDYHDGVLGYYHLFKEVSNIWRKI